MGNVIKIDDGYKTYDIVNQDDKLLGQFSFNPSDTNIIHRHAEVVEALEKLEMDIKIREIPMEKRKIFFIHPDK